MTYDESRTFDVNELKVTKPISVWNRDINISSKDLLSGIGKIAIKGVSLDWSGAGETALDTFNAAGLQKEPGEIAWLLIYRSLISAISSLTKNYRDLFEDPPNDEVVETLSDSFEKVMEKIEVTIDLQFFDKPGDFRLLEDLTVPLVNWMKGLGSTDDNAKKICSHLPDYFVTALNEKWCDAPQDYVSLKEFFNTPFTQASEKRRGWRLYNLWLKSQVNERMFAETFGVDKVYVPLRAYYEQKEDWGVSTTKKIVIDLETDFKEWLNAPFSEPAVRFISGGPGSGKSTFAKIFACSIANEKNISTLYIPLHLFDATDNLISAMETYIKGNKFLSGNPLDSKEGESRLLIVFDGLDELALMGQAASEVANNFVEEVLRRIHQVNSEGLRRKVIITGRTIAIQSVENNLRKLKQICYVLPYYIKNKDKFEDPEELLKTDQRKIWWKQYGEVTGKYYSSIPEILNRRSFEEITAQPLLNYLVALSYGLKRIVIKDDTTLNQIYANLIRGVYHRKYDGGRVSVSVLEEDQFIRSLEEIAIEVWHGDGRTATVSSIQERCKVGGIQKYLDLFQEGPDAGVTRLLTAFYFHRSENCSIGDPTFEFTHKSFGEYLAALRILRVLREIQTQKNRKNEAPNGNWTAKESLERWTEFCSSRALDIDLMRFINNEFLRMGHEELTELQNIVRELLTYTINQGFPLPKGIIHGGLKEVLRKTRNAEEALLAIHHGIAKNTKQISELNLTSTVTFGEWISRLRGQRQGIENNIALNSMGYLNLSKSKLLIQDFLNADFQGVDFTQAFLNGANLNGANLVEANLERANLENSNLEGANFKNANLIGANLKETNLVEANLEGANLENASLEGANLKGANFRRANLKNTNRINANFSEATVI